MKNILEKIYYAPVIFFSKFCVGKTWARNFEMVGKISKLWACLRLSDIARELGPDWVPLALELHIPGMSSWHVGVSLAWYFILDFSWI